MPKITPSTPPEMREARRQSDERALEDAEDELQGIPDDRVCVVYFIRCISYTDPFEYCVINIPFIL